MEKLYNFELIIQGCNQDEKVGKTCNGVFENYTLDEIKSFIGRLSENKRKILKTIIYKNTSKGKKVLDERHYVDVHGEYLYQKLSFDDLKEDNMSYVGNKPGKYYVNGLIQPRENDFVYLWHTIEEIDTLEEAIRIMNEKKEEERMLSCTINYFTDNGDKKTIYDEVLVDVNGKIEYYEKREKNKKLLKELKDIKSILSSDDWFNLVLDKKIEEMEKEKVKKMN